MARLETILPAAAEDIARRGELLSRVAALPIATHPSGLDAIAGLGSPQVAAAEPDPRQVVATLAQAGLLDECVAQPDGDGVRPLSVRALCLIRAALAYRSPLYDLMFVMQGLGSHAVSQAGSAAQRAAYLPRVATGQALAALALTEPGAGSDLAGIQTRATRTSDGGYRIDGQKVFISNAGCATHYVVYARTDAHPKKGLSAFLVPADAAGLSVTPMRLLCDDHPIGAVNFAGVLVPADARIGDEGQGMSLSLSTLARFRPTVGAAAVGMAARALDEAIAHVRRRQQFGQALSTFQATQMRLAELATELQAAALLVQHAAQAIDRGGAGHDTVGTASAMAKLYATEVAGRVVDGALQLHGGCGLVAGSVLERLYRDVRALRIYEGTSEVQKLIIARGLLSP